jgi:cell division transport system permease protein
MHSFLRALSFALKDFWRNIWLSLVTITVLVLALLSFNILISLNAVSGKIVDSVKERVDVSVFFKPEVQQAQIDNFREKVKQLPEVKEVKFISKETALENFRILHKDDPKINDALKELEKNPMVDTVVVKASNIEDYNKILDFIKLDSNQEIIKYQNFTDHQKIIDSINSISNKIKKISLAITGIFVLIAILIVFNAIRVMLYTYKEEITVMRLVGASAWFIRLPFLLESVLYSIFATGLAFLLLYAIFGALGPSLAAFFSSYNFNLIQYYNEHFLVIFFSQLGAVVFLNIVSSGIAIRRYLKG